MLRDPPNTAVVMGYTNASWTLKADLPASTSAARFKHYDASAVAAVHATRLPPRRVKDALFRSGLRHIQRAAGKISAPGRPRAVEALVNYLLDLRCCVTANLRMTICSSAHRMSVNPRQDAAKWSRVERTAKRDSIIDASCS
jgi:hypothetical protein